MLCTYIKRIILTYYLHYSYVVPTRKVSSRNYFRDCPMYRLYRHLYRQVEAHKRIQQARTIPVVKSKPLHASSAKWGRRGRALTRYLNLTKVGTTYLTFLCKTCKVASFTADTTPNNTNKLSLCC